jgi:ATP-dependent HslUV protease ATP-binding subunit HslU
MDHTLTAAKALDDLTPAQIVAELDKYIVGQAKAKRAVAVALRNRVRRLRLPAESRDDITPKNILMIGPTGVGKTEIARRLAKLTGSPFIKVEATKYTEVGYVGRDVESMIRDLMAAGVQMVKTEMQEAVRPEAERRAEEALLDLLLPGSAKRPAALKPEEPLPADPSREKFREMLRSGKLDDRSVELSLSQASPLPAMELFSGASGGEEFEGGLAGLAGIFGGGKKKKSVGVRRAKELLFAEEAEKLIDRDKVSEEARRRVQETGIVFIDEIDKIAGKGERSGADVSREGVQRDILPIVEGSTVNTKWGAVDTAHILFVAAGAFNVSKPSDLIPELQGRFPLRVELEALGKADFLRILTEPKNALTKQYADLLSTDGVTIEFLPEAVDRLAGMAAEVNSRLENIGARRLHTIMEALLEDISFRAPDVSPTRLEIGAAYVEERLAGLAKDQDLGRYIL